jgi:hypothetical protein
MAAGDLTPIQLTIDQGIVEPYGLLQQVRGSPFRSMFADQVMPTKAELVRMGKVFSVSGGVVANGVIPVVDQPTVVNTNGLYNNNSVGSNIHLLLLKISLYACSGTLGLGRGIVAGVSGPQAAAPSAGTGVVGPKNHMPTSTNTSNAIMSTNTNSTLTPTLLHLGGLDTPAAPEIGAGIAVDVEGLFIVPPTYIFTSHVVAPTGTTAKFLFTFTYAEYQMIPQ